MPEYIATGHWSWKCPTAGKRFKSTLHPSQEDRHMYTDNVVWNIIQMSVLQPAAESQIKIENYWMIKHVPQGRDHLKSFGGGPSLISHQNASLPSIKCHRYNAQIVTWGMQSSDSRKLTHTTYIFLWRWTANAPSWLPHVEQLKWIKMYFNLSCDRPLLIAN